MYCADTLKRLNEAEVDRLRKAVKGKKRKSKEKPKCDYCDNVAVEVIPVYNPADAVRNVKGAYSTITICQDCLDKGRDLEDEVFICDGCGQHFVTHHSWDSLVVTLEDGQYCHECASKNIEPICLSHLLSNLREKKTDGFTRLNAIPGKKEIWNGEFSEFSDFPGHTSLSSVADEIEKTAEKNGLHKDALVYPLITHTYQFSIVLGIYA